MGHMSMVGIAYMNNHNLDYPEIVDLLITGFSSILRWWWDSYLTEDSRESIKIAVKKNDESLPIFLWKYWSRYSWWCQYLNLNCS